MAPTSWQRVVAVAGFGLLAAAAVLRVGDAVAGGGGSDAGWMLRVVYGGVMAAVLCVVTVAAVRRPASVEQATSARAYVAAAVAVGSLYFVEAPTSGGGGVALAGVAMAVVSAVWVLVSVLALGRCFGLLPEARGLVTRGPYRVVRHPIYLGEIGAVAGLAVAATTVQNVFVLAAFVAAQVVRMRLEEEQLVRHFPEYSAYAIGRPRLVPMPGLLRRRSSPHRVLRGDVS
jgi:protein-S-isoprenylcysteine O-methyltransferase Ste14